jgi:hypothetical protein
MSLFPFRAAALVTMDRSRVRGAVLRDSRQVVAARNKARERADDESAKNEKRARRAGAFKIQNEMKARALRCDTFILDDRFA